MIFILILIIAFLITLAILYAVQFYIDLEGDSSNIIKDGLVGEFLTKATNAQIPVQIGYDKIFLGRFEIVKSDNMFWFPYYVYRNSLPFDERGTDELDWGAKIGYVRWLSKDWKLIKKLIKEWEKAETSKKKKDQRKQLLLDK